MTPGQRVWAFLGSFEGGVAVLVMFATVGLLVNDWRRWRDRSMRKDQ